jgi:Gp157 protein
MDPSLVMRELHHHGYWQERLRAEFPEADEETVRDTLEGLTNLSEMLACVVRSYLDDLSMIAALGMRHEDMQARLSRLEARAEKKRALITVVMEQANIRKLAESDFTASLRPTSAPLIITSEQEIPARYWKPQPPKLDRLGLLTSLRAGETVPGAALGNGQVTLSVRSK